MGAWLAYSRRPEGREERGNSVLDGEGGGNKMEGGRGGKKRVHVQKDGTYVTSKCNMSSIELEGRG